MGTSVAEYAERRRRDCEQHGITWQPQVLVLGPDALHVEQVFVLVNDVVFPITSTVKAIDICFKLFQVLTLNIWLNVDWPGFVYNVLYMVLRHHTTKQLLESWK